MRAADRHAAVLGKLRHFGEELAALRTGGAWYGLLFGFLAILLVPVLVVEIVLIYVIGFDPGILQTRDAVVSNELQVGEVPDEFLDLVSLAEKWGIGDAEEREAVIRGATRAELEDMETAVGPRVQAIADWLDGFSEAELARSATAGCFEFLLVAYEEVADHLGR